MPRRLQQYLALQYCRKILFQIIGTTETHIKDKEKISDINITGKCFKFFEGGIKGANNFAGVGCIIDSNLKPTFNRINDRICLAVAYTDSK